jgi:short-subunit dehydrogenase
MNTEVLEPRTSPPCAVVTGATQGIGKAIAEKLLSEGYELAICARNSNDLDELKSNWEQKYPSRKILALSSDFSLKNEVLDFAKNVLATFSQVDLLVNNAGIFIPGALATEPEGHLDTVMNVNLYSAYHLTRALLPSMPAGSHIINMCSVASLKAYPNGGAYSISKYALLGFSENLREELKPQKIRVTAICPGATWSRSWSGSGLPEERLMDAEDVANMVWAAHQLSAKADVEIIVMRPIDGDL